MVVKVGFFGSVKLKVDDKYKILDDESIETFNENMSLVSELEKEVATVVRNKLKENGIDAYNFDYCESEETGNTIWDY